MEKLISIVIPCYNVEKYLDKCFDSIIQQTIGLENLQVIFVDDCSQDNTYNKILEYQKDYPDSVQSYRLEKKGVVGGARNFALERVVGEYLLFVDADDWLDVKACEKLYEVAQKFDLDMIQYEHACVVGEQEMRMNNALTGYVNGNDVGTKRSILVGNLFPFGCLFKLYRTSLVRGVGVRFAEGVVYEEPVFVYPLLAYAQRLYLLDESLYYYRRDNLSITRGFITSNNRILDHPYVQLEALKKMSSDSEFVKQYYNELEFYFLKTYYIETICFASDRLFLEVQEFRKMQEMVKNLFPEYYDNPYIQMKQPEMEYCRRVLDSLNRSFEQEELNRFCKLCDLELTKLELRARSSN